MPLRFYCLRTWAPIHQANKTFGIGRSLVVIHVPGSSEPLYRCYGARSSTACAPLPKLFMCIALSFSWKSLNRSGFAHAIDTYVTVRVGRSLSSFSCHEIPVWHDTWEAAVVWGVLWVTGARCQPEHSMQSPSFCRALCCFSLRPWCCPEALHGATRPPALPHVHKCDMRPCIAFSSLILKLLLSAILPR